jgi:hypothetical protein
MAALMLAALSAGQMVRAYGQASPTAVQPLRISAFGGLTATDTGLASGKNAGITAGLDIGFLPLFRLYPSAELRGNYAFDQGSVDGQKSILGGLKIAAHLGRIQPYGDFLFGRGEMNYASGFQRSHTNIFYTQSSSNVISPGGGVDLTLSDRWAMKFDVQLQHWSSPVTPTGHQYATAGTLGITYHFDFNHPRRNKR